MVSFVFFASDSTHNAAEATQDTYATKVLPEVPIPKLTARAWGIFDGDSGEILHGEETDAILPIASIAKLLTADTVLDNSRAHIPFTISSNDVATEGRAGKLIAGATTTPYELLFPLLMESSNDAAVAIARVLGNEYKESIATHMRTLDLTQTRIADPSGLSDETTSSVRDLVRLYVHIREEHPHLFDITQLYTYIGTNTGYVNNDPARTFPHFVGGKHGYTDEAGRTFIGTFKYEEHTVGVVVLGSADLSADIEALLAYYEASTVKF